MIQFNYKIDTDTLNGTVNRDKLNHEFLKANISDGYISFVVFGNTIRFMYEDNADADLIDPILDELIANHDGMEISNPKIYRIYDNLQDDQDFRDLDYTIKNLHPMRFFNQGELNNVKWYEDQTLNSLVLDVDISYVRDPFGFAISRSTKRVWINEDNTENELTKETNKTYSPLEMIVEGKKRRQNIVDGIQLPTMSFMIETMTNTSNTVVLLMGRDFLDRFETEFSRFVKNSSSVTDFNDPNFGKKNVIVALENAETTTDTWLANKPQSLGGNIRILDYLISEFNIWAKH